MRAGDWKRWYAAERAALGEPGLARLLDAAPTVAFPPHGALVFPHARLAACGTHVAAVAKAVVASGTSTVVALGVLHGGRAADAADVAAAKAGEPAAVERLRRCHGPGAPGDAGCWTEEFSLDNFKALLDLAARRAGKPSPQVIERYPVLVGATPGSLPGLEDLRIPGAVLVATTDPAHHGHGYGTPPAEIMDDAAPSTAGRVLSALARTFGHLARREYHAFLKQCEEQRSDFRDVGPAMRELIDTPCTSRILDLRLVDYSDVLETPRPTWVAAALAVFGNFPGQPASNPA